VIRSRAGLPDRRWPWRSPRRAATQEEGLQPALVGIALPRNVARRLEAQKLLSRRAIESPPAGVSSGASEWVFQPGAIATLQKEGFFFVVL
jgi:hypothetical protein